MPLLSGSFPVSTIFHHISYNPSLHASCLERSSLVKRGELELPTPLAHPLKLILFKDIQGIGRCDKRDGFKSWKSCFLATLCQFHPHFVRFGSIRLIQTLWFCAKNQICSAQEQFESEEGFDGCGFFRNEEETEETTIEGWAGRFTHHFILCHRSAWTKHRETNKGDHISNDTRQSWHIMTYHDISWSISTEQALIFDFNVRLVPRGWPRGTAGHRRGHVTPGGPEDRRIPQDSDPCGWVHVEAFHVDEDFDEVCMFHMLQQCFNHFFYHSQT